MNKLAITICATEKYSYAVNAQAYSVQSAIYEYIRCRNTPLKVSLILVSDGCKKMCSLENLYIKLLSHESIKLEILHRKLHDIKQPKVGYKTEAQRLIARLRSIAFSLAKNEVPDYCLSLDSDILIKANALVCMEDALTFDNYYYSVAMSTYPSQGGGAFLGGRGSYARRILENVYNDEKNVPEKILNRLESLKNQYNECVTLIRSETQEDKINIHKKIRTLNSKMANWHKYVSKRMPATGNVFELNGKGWRQRGWFDFAYPGIGKGSIVPIDWTGFGCLLINRKALNFIDFHGYIGEGTEDLFINWERWYPNGIKIACLPHCPSDHVIRKRTQKGENFNELFLIFSHHQVGGESDGHLRQIAKPFIDYLVE